MIVYMTINLINKKKYIGKDTKNKKEYLGSGILLKKALEKYGKENFKKIILEKCSDKKNLEEREKWWISFFDAVKSKEFYNLLDGGVGGSVVGHKVSEETREKIRKAKLGTKKLESSYKKFYKPILQYDFNGFFLKEFISKKAVEEELGSRIGTMPNDRPRFSRGYFFLWKKNDNFERKIEVKKVYQTLKVGKFDKNSNLLEEFENLTLAIKKYKNDHIRAVCNGKRKTACGYIWKYI